MTKLETVKHLLDLNNQFEQLKNAVEESTIDIKDYSTIKFKGSTNYEICLNNLLTEKEVADIRAYIHDRLVERLNKVSREYDSYIISKEIC